METVIEWEELPVAIQQRMLEIQLQIKGVKNEEHFKRSVISGFFFGDAPEGFNFWARIIYEGKIETFYEKYPKDTFIEIGNCRLDLNTLTFTKKNNIC